MNSTQLTQPQYCACANLRQAARAITQFYDAKLRPTGLRATQFTVLFAASLTEQIPITDLAERLGMDRTTLTRNLRPLETKGLLVIESGQDHRTRLVGLTSQGRATVAEAMPLWEKAQKHFVREMGPERFGGMLADLGEIIAATR